VGVLCAGKRGLLCVIRCMCMCMCVSVVMYMYVCVVRYLFLGDDGKDVVFVSTVVCIKMSMCVLCV